MYSVPGDSLSIIIIIIGRRFLLVHAVQFVATDCVHRYGKLKLLMNNHGHENRDATASSTDE